MQMNATMAGFKETGFQNMGFGEAYILICISALIMYVTSF